MTSEQIDDEDENGTPPRALHLPRIHWTARISCAGKFWLGYFALIAAIIFVAKRWLH
jgi:hypothetical protein